LYISPEHVFGTAKIIVRIGRVLGLVGILYIFGSTMISTGSAVTNEALTNSGILGYI
jgi:hypothetical protein